MCQNFSENFLYSGISKMVDILRRSSILPFAEDVTTSHPQMFQNFFVTTVGTTAKNQIKSKYNISAKNIS